jgi:pimeloyl-ACP methyl ester carboxylesterase
LPTPIPIGIAAGFGSGPEGYRPLTEALTAHGYQPELFTYRRRGATQRTRGLPTSLVRQAWSIIGDADARGVTRMILLGHSMGAAVGALVARLRPDLVERLIPVCPATVHPDSPLALGYRIGRKLGDERRHMKTLTGAELAIMKAAARETVRYCLSAPWWALAEGWRLGRYSLERALGPQSVDTWYVVGSLDPVFPEARLRQALGRVPDKRILSLPLWHDPQKVPAQSQLLVQTLHEHQLLIP